MITVTRFNRIATAAVGALLVSSACVAAAIGPAAAGTPAPVHAAAQPASSVQASA